MDNNNDTIIKGLIKTGAVMEQIRYDVSVMMLWKSKELAKEIKNLGISETEFRSMLEEYGRKRKIFGFYTFSKRWDELKFLVGDYNMKK